MRTRHITFCEQTHPECRGYACDDHIDTHCYTVVLDCPEHEVMIDLLLEKAERVY